MFKKTLSWMVIITMVMSLFIAIPIKTKADTVVKNIFDADILPNGNIAVLYISDQKVYYGVLDPNINKWSKQEVGNGKDAALAIDGTGSPHIAYITTNDDLAYTHFNGTSWSAAVTIDSLNFNDVQGILTSPDIAIDPAGKAHISYHDSRGGNDGYNNYSSYDKADLMYATNASGNFINGVSAYSQGDTDYSSYYSMVQVLEPSKIVYADNNYYIGAEEYGFYRTVMNNYKDYSYAFKLYPLANSMAQPNSYTYPIGTTATVNFTLYSMDTDGTNVYSLFNKTGNLYVTNGVSAVPSAVKAFTGNAADLFVKNSGQVYYAGINTSSLLLYQNGNFKESLTLPLSISTTNKKMATVVREDKQYVLYTDTSGDIWVCGISTEAGNSNISSFKIPDKLPVTITGLSVESRDYNGDAIAASGTPSSVVDGTYDAALISDYSYTWYDITGSKVLTEAPKAAGSYKLIVSVPENDESYTGNLEIPFSITPKAITISGVTAVNRAYNGGVSVAITGGTLSGIIEGDAVSPSVPSVGSVLSSNAENNKLVTIANITLSGADSPNYTLVQPTDIKVNITKAALSINGVTVSNKTYDGEASAHVSNVAFNGLQNGETLTINTDYAASGVFNNAQAGTGKTVTGMVALTTTIKTMNYSLNNGLYTTIGDILKASGLIALNPSDIKMIKNQVNSYSFDLSTIGLNKADTGAVTYELGALTGRELFSQVPEIAPDGSTLTFTSEAVESRNASQVIKISTENYENVSASITFILVDKTPITITGVSVGSRTYNGNVISASGIPSAKITETGNAAAIPEYSYTWYDLTENKVMTGAPKKAGSYKLIVSVPDSNKSYTGNLEIPFSITKKDLIIKPKDKKIYENAPFPNSDIEYLGFVTGEYGYDAISLSENYVMEIQDESGNKLISSSTIGTYKIVFTNSPSITSDNYNVATEDGTLIIESKPAVLINYQTVDDESEIKLFNLEDRINLPEKNQENVTEINLSIEVKNAGDDLVNKDILKAAEEELKDKGYTLLNTFDISIIKKIVNEDGTITEIKVPRSDITGLITVIIPVPENLKNKDNLAAAFIDSEGNVEILLSKRISLNGQDYLEFETDHFSIYGIVKPAGSDEAVDNIIPKTGGLDSISYYFMGILLLGAGIFILSFSLKKKKE